jgi:prolyl 4-hydroxylase
MRLIETKNNDSFIRQSLIDPIMCDKIINYFEENKNLQERGVLGDDQFIDLDIKDSYDLTLSPDDSIAIEYSKHLNFCTREYIFNYWEALDVASEPYSISGMNIQKYPPGGGFKRSHYESATYNMSHRILVYMTYLNDCDGGTYFPYQNIEIKPKKGLTIIWPATFTHLHKGVTDYNKTKYIITGWFSFVDSNK